MNKDISSTTRLTKSSNKALAHSAVVDLLAVDATQAEGHFSFAVDARFFRVPVQTFAHAGPKQEAIVPEVPEVLSVSWPAALVPAAQASVVGKTRDFGLSDVGPEFVSEVHEHFALRFDENGRNFEFS